MTDLIPYTADDGPLQPSRVIFPPDVAGSDTPTYDANSDTLPIEFQKWERDIRKAHGDTVNAWWRMADLLLDYERYSDEVAQVLSELGITEKQFNQMRWLARKWPKDKRIPGAQIGLYQAATHKDLPDEVEQTLVREAHEEGLTVNKVWDKKRELLKKPGKTVTYSEERSVNMWVAKHNEARPEDVMMTLKKSAPISDTAQRMHDKLGTEYLKKLIEALTKELTDDH